MKQFARALRKNQTDAEKNCGIGYAICKRKIALKISDSSPNLACILPASDVARLLQVHLSTMLNMKGMNIIKKEL